MLGSIDMHKAVAIFACLTVSACGGTPPANDLEEANTEVVRIFMEEILGRGQVERITEVMAEDYVQHAPNIGNGLEGFRAFAEAANVANRPFDVTIHRTMAQGDLVWVFVSMNLPNGTRAAMDFFRLEDGKLVEHWGVGEIVPAQDEFVDPSTGFF